MEFPEALVQGGYFHITWNRSTPRQADSKIGERKIFQ